MLGIIIINRSQGVRTARPDYKRWLGSNHRKVALRNVPAYFTHLGTVDELEDLLLIEAGICFFQPRSIFTPLAILNMTAWVFDND